jgi:hypothetical protein
MTNWFDVLGFPVLRAPEAVANVASLRISEKPVCVLLPPSNATMFRVDSQRKSGEITAEEWRAKRLTRLPDQLNRVRGVGWKRIAGRHGAIGGRIAGKERQCVSPGK